jgi:predicted glycosyltransferase
MRFIVEMGHPGHVHHFKNMIWSLEKKGHEVQICTTDKEVTLDLLDKYGFAYTVLGKNKSKGIIRNIPLLLGAELKMYLVTKKFRPDIFICRGSPISAHISRIFRKPCISFNDTEHSSLVDSIVFPFLDVILTPSCFMKDLGMKQIRYNGYHELAYLHPDYFHPDPEVLNEFDLLEGDPFTVLRFVSWGAGHDIGHHGIENKLEFVKELEKYGRVLITSEADIGPEFEKYKIKVSPEKLHDLLYYATLCVGDGGTTAVESAVLGTPSIYISSLVGTMGNFVELEEKYGLMFSYKDSQVALEKATVLIKNPNIKDEWNEKRNQLLNEKIDVTSFMVDFVSNYS